MYSIDLEMQSLFGRAVKKRGLKGFLKTLLSDEETTREVVEEVAEQIKSSGKAEEALDRLNALDVLISEIGDYVEGVSVLDGIVLLDGEPVGLAESLRPLKGKRKLFKEALERVAEAREELGLGNEAVYKAMSIADRMPEWDPFAEAEARKSEKQFREAEITLKLLDELPQVKAEKKKLLGFIPRYHVTLNPGYEEFFHSVLGSYSKDEVYRALKSLEKELSGRNREKVRALRKEFEKREGISRNRKWALFLAAALIGGAGGYLAYSMHKQHGGMQTGTSSSVTQTSTSTVTQTSTHTSTTTVTQTNTQTSTTHTTTPTVTKTSTSTTQTNTHTAAELLKIYSVKYPSKIKTNSYLPIDVNASADRVLVQVSVNGVEKNVSAKLLDGVFHVNLPVKEGVYEIEKVYAFRNGKSLVKDVNAVLKAFDKPVISGVSYQRKLKPGDEAVVKVNASDTSGIAKAWMKVVAPDKKTFVVKGIKEDGLYVFSFPLKEEPAYSFTVVVEDPFNQSAVYKGSISSLDNPVIHSFDVKKMPSKGIVEVVVNASDTSGIAKALIELNGRNASMVKLGNGLYAYNISLGEDPVSFPVKVYVLDPFGQAAFSAGEIYWLLKDAFTYYAVKHGFTVDKAQGFYKQYKDLVESFYPSDKSEMLAPLHVYDVNASLLWLAKQKVYGDSNVSDKSKVLIELSKALYGLREKSLNDASLDYLGNLTAYLKASPLKAFNRSVLWDVLNLTEEYPIVVFGLSGKYPLKGWDTYILTYLVEKDFGKVEKYPYLLWALSSQAGEIARLINQNHPAVLFAVKGKVKNFNITDRYGTNSSYVQLVEKRLKRILRNYEQGLWMIGMDPKEVLKKTGKALTADLWMKEVVMPFSIISGDALKGRRIPYAYPQLSENYPEKAVLLVFSDNLKAMDKFTKMVKDYLRGNLTWTDKWGRNWNVDNWTLRMLNDLKRYNNISGRDWSLLLNNGSEIAKWGVRTFSGSFYNVYVAKKYGLTPMKMEEFRVSLGMNFGATIGVPIFASSIKDKDNYWHGMCSGPITVDDYKLLKRVDNSSLMWDPVTRDLLQIITRKNANYWVRPIGTEKPCVIIWKMTYPVVGFQKEGSERVIVYRYNG